MTADTHPGGSVNITPEIRQAVLEQERQMAHQRRLDQLAKAREVRAQKREQNRDRMLAQLAQARAVRSRKAAERRAAAGRTNNNHSSSAKTGPQPMPVLPFGGLPEVSRLSKRGNPTESHQLYRALQPIAQQLNAISTQLAALIMLNQAQGPQ